MYAVVKIGGNQYKVTPKDTLQVDHLAGNVGDTVKFPALLVADGDRVEVGKEAFTTEVVMKILSHLRGEKIDVHRFRAKSRTRRHVGFRASLTNLEVQSIGQPQAKPKKAKAVSSKTSHP
ncbi:MAG: 50S ribosomal protein L21 [Candidatus Gottesmanbacteria bacterium GW2011_GWB1_43_11]|uniref:Large ribosomal subunit protein bL21 n=1 Tax=Candidatus Gottesmanbacteria bacterium GW2011_GWB1_43_11 TaxID=1618446 RepID=A0A0G1FKV2_9BACT|nr:MAG: 50S ribosomal protein L21 [Candidatus Gottesmanbacteria bacterium GW2011_GWA2_42_16]KKS55981.1 MAG: 50S ribosomal protein L21 [Candidatus Gottesmanbacteria bacterium GW2011_GWA1_42_26]KKS82349.1 MAG: 50S ribosomal protein L21 [Candidatus Gottesmanbacteria bacterium GW2011_GWC1_43_10]KKS87543.1 MAG: 50S ribosomal protein L21 [Candidatus Gottesmanbacteria bacterium GW2011_GWB1_43_11]OGG10356.1 MAG: 50S ribosomal protein L21 [Candidatus Gottesmanbacteria bacterium RIFCSPHIGHO2_01_FULL_43_1